MAIYKEAARVRPSASKAFDRVMRAGAEAPFDGIYRCTGCGLERAVTGGRLLPNNSQVKHPQWCEGLRWQLLVATTGAMKPRDNAGEADARPSDPPP